MTSTEKNLNDIESGQFYNSDVVIHTDIVSVSLSRLEGGHFDPIL